MSVIASIIGGGGGAVTVENEVPAGLINDANTVYTTAFDFVAGTEQVYLNGVRQQVGGGNDYTITDTDEITFNTAPETLDTLLIDYVRT